MSSIRPLRSILFMPGNNARAIDKARGLDCDGVILDLEDAVAPDGKADARATACAAVAEGGFGHRRVAIRINALDTPQGVEDLRHVARAGPDAIVLPKVTRARTLREAEMLMDSAGAPSATRLWCMIETPAGVLAAERIAAATSRLECIVMGTSDLGKEMRVAHRPGRAAFRTALGLCLLAARAHGRHILDGVWPDIADADGFAAECREGAALGFDGKALVHPGQIAAANAAFAPDPAALADARAIVEAWEARHEGAGIAVLDGRMIEDLHVEEARRLLALDAAIAARTDAA